jgi:Zn-dependent M28 family amino/carboxypeptidase
MRCGLAWLLVLAVYTGTTAASGDSDARLAERIEAHIRFLADDQLRGRQPGTEGYDIAAAYVASQYLQMGLQPAGDAGSYLQQVPLRRAWLEPGSAQLDIVSGTGRQPLVFLEQFYIGPSLAHAVTDIDAGAVFAGHGIHAPPLEHDDYAGIDATGKVVVALAGQPRGFPSEEGAHFASTREKLLAAAAHGAVGVVLIYTPRTREIFPWERLASRVGTPSMDWLTAEDQAASALPQLQVEAVLHHSAAGPLFDGSGHGLADLIARDEAGEALPTFDLQSRVHLAQRSRFERITSPNVVAVLPGADPLLSGQYVVYTAHLDHIGELAGDGHEDAINNGALDNASGVAVMLETARLLSEGEPPRRSVLFVAVTAEEKGLVGSGYFATHPTVPAAAMAGVINLDMPLLLYDFGDIIAFGAAHSGLGEAAEQAAQEFGVTLTPDPFPDQNIFVRSDHYRFVQQGVPAIFLVTGPKSRDGTDTMPIFQGFLQEHYHSPSDDLNLPIRYDAAARFTRINTRIGEIVADALERPAWREGSFFGERFGR